MRRMLACGFALWWSGCGDEETGKGEGSESGSPPIVSPGCGDGVIQEGEACDDGAENAEGAACLLDCVLATCGDGRLWIGAEGCDDGNLVGADGCSPACALPVTHDRSDADATYTGDPTTQVGEVFAGVGDVNGDGGVDVLIGGPGYATSTGAVFLLVDPLLDRTVEFADGVLVGEVEDDNAGTAIAAAGDLDGDGFDDVLVGAYSVDRAGARSGAVYVMHGAMGIAGAADLASADAIVYGVAKDELVGYSLAGRGHANGDGTPDLLIGAPGNGLYVGAVYVVSGAVSGEIDATEADATLLGETDYDEAGYTTAWLGDVDGDGKDDLATAAPWRGENGPNSGVVYVVHGPFAGTSSLGDADATWLGSDSYRTLGYALSAAGDFDGDGLRDLLASQVSTTPDVARLFVLRGSASGTVSVEDALLQVLDPEGWAYNARGTTGDFDDDGIRDLAVAGQDDTGAGAVVVFLGAPTGEVSLADADAHVGGEKGDIFGAGVANPGDLDGDGRDDLLVGATGVEQVVLFLGASLLAP